MAFPRLEIQLVAALVAAACALPGVFLVLRRMSLLSDAISHSILLGIVIGYFLVRDSTHPLVVAAAAATGVLTVSLTEMIYRTRLLKEDAAVGLVFPVLFSLGVILISRFARDVHIDVDTVLLGELAFAPLNRLTLLGLDLPRGIWVMGGILLINVAVIAAFYKELKLATFDPALAAALGFSPALLHYGLMSLVSVTAVGAFDHVGSVLVVALMIAPPAAAYLLTESLGRMLIYSAGIGIGSAVAGYWLARWLDVNISGAMAAMTGVAFLLALLLAPDRGLLAGARLRARRRRQFAVEMLLVHLSRHEGTDAEAVENTLTHLMAELKWHPDFARMAVQQAQQEGLITRTNGHLLLTGAGRQMAGHVLTR